MYKEIEVQVYGHQNKLETFRININNIGYYRQYTQTPEETGEESCLNCMLFTIGSIKGIRVKCSSDELQAKIRQAALEDN